MSRNPFGWSLPPGVTDRMIEEAMGGDEDLYCTTCDGAGYFGNGDDYEVDSVCPDCKGTGLKPDNNKEGED